MSSDVPAWFDAHMHVFDPRFPTTPNAGYLPSPFTVADYRSRVAALPAAPAGGAVVAASTQGTGADGQGYLLAALAELGPGWVGVTQLGGDVEDDALVALHEAGVRAVRFNLHRGGRKVLTGLEDLARRVHDVVGWHSELYVDGRAVVELAQTIRALPRVCIDHLGLTREGLPELVRLAGQGVFVKASGFGRTDFPAAEAVRDIHAANPGALVFGTDLPCPRAPRPFQDDDFFLLDDVLGPDQAVRVRWRNAVELYRPAEVPAAGTASSSRNR